MKFPVCNPSKKQIAPFSIVSVILTIAPLWLMLVAITPAHAQTTSSPADWTQFLRDNMQRWNPYETMLGVNNVGRLQLKWKNTIGRDIGGLQPIITVANGVAYFGSNGSGIYALDADTGALLWNHPTPNAAEIAAPAVVNGVLYVGSGGNDLVALNASTGAQLWSFSTGFYVYSSPTVVNGVV
jgi:outer membrane protein assembly factor BamB